MSGRDGSSSTQLYEAGLAARFVVHFGPAHTDAEGGRPEEAHRAVPSVLSIPGLPGSRTITATMSSPIDTYTVMITGDTTATRVLPTCNRLALVTSLL